MIEGTVTVVVPGEFWLGSSVPTERVGVRLVSLPFRVSVEREKRVADAPRGVPEAAGYRP